MLKKGTLISIIILTIALAVTAYFLQQKREAYIASPYKTIPVDAGIVIEAVNLPDLFEELSGSNDLFDELRGVKALAKFSKGISVIDSLVHLREIRVMTGVSPVLISFHRMGRDRVEPFYSVALPPDIKERHIREMLTASEVLKYTVKEYQGEKIFEVETRTLEPVDFFISYIKGVLVISRSGILVESAIRQAEQVEDIRSLPGFTEVASAAGRNDNKLFLVFNNLQKITELLAPSGKGPLARAIGELAASAEADIYLKSNNLMVSGYIAPTDTSHTLHRYMEYAPGPFESYSVIPSNVAMFEALTGSRDAGAPLSLSVEGVTRYISDIVASQLEGEITKMYFDINGEEEAESRMILFRLKGQNATEKAFAEELSTYYEKKGVSRESFVLNYSPDEERAYTIYLLPDDRLPYALAGKFAGNYGGPYATFYEGYLVLGESRVAVSKFIYDNILRRTLANDLGYRDFDSNMPTRSTYYFYCSPSRITDLFPDIFKESIVTGAEKYINAIKKIEAIGLQLMPGNDMLYTTLSVSYRPEVKEQASAQWESLLDTILYSKPLFFTNHYTGRNEIFVQDLKNNVYLINGAGRILWKQRLSEPIQGDPVMIDYYKNGKYQILFATTNRLHLLDRNGNYVERFPVSLRSPASGGLSVFDYENNKDYRLFICGSDRLVYLYDKTGNTVRGWEQFRTNRPVTFPVEFFRVSGKDYLVINDDQNMYILDRRGSVRVRVQEQIARAPGSQLRMTTEATPRLVLSTVDGMIKFISLGGEVESVSTGEFSSKHIFDMFDIDSDGQGEYFFIDDGKVHAFDHNMSKMFVQEAGSDNILGPYGLVFGASDRKLGFVDADNGKVHLIDSRGKNIKGFPLPGATPFSVGKLTGGSGFNLITGGKDSFVYNYELTR